MLFNTIEELRACLSSLPSQNAGKMLSFVSPAETLHLVPVLGEGLVEQLGNLPATDAPAHLVALREKLRLALAYYVALEAAPFLPVSLSDLGINEGQTTNSPATRQWVYNNFIEAASATADKLLDVALAWLDSHAADYADELDSSEYRSRKSLLIGTAAQLGQYVATAGSRRFFLALLPTLRRVEELDMEDLLGTDLLEQLREGLASGEEPSAEADKLLRLVRPVLAHLAIAQGITSMSVALTGTSLRLLSDNEAIRERLAASPAALSALSQQAAGHAARYQAKLTAYLDARSPAAAPVSAELYDNSNSPSFVV
jgi:hypothetical protein